MENILESNKNLGEFQGKVKFKASVNPVNWKVSPDKLIVPGKLLQCKFLPGEPHLENCDPGQFSPKNSHSVK